MIGNNKNKTNNFDIEVKKYSNLLDIGRHTFKDYADKINKSAVKGDNQAKWLVGTLLKFPNFKIEKTANSFLYQPIPKISEAVKKAEKVAKKYGNTFEEVYDSYDSIYLIRDFVTFDTELTKNINLLVVAKIWDLEDAVAEEDLPKEGNWELRLTILPNENKIARKILIEANSDNHSMSDNSLVNVEHYTGGLRYSPEKKHHFMTSDEALEYLVSDELNNQIDEDAEYYEDVLYSFYNRAGDTNEKILKYIIGERKQMFKEGGSTEVEYYVAQTRFFDINSYPIKKISNIVKANGGYDITTEKYNGWGNQPTVVVFKAIDEYTIETIKKALQDFFKTENIRIEEKYWVIYNDINELYPILLDYIIQNYVIEKEKAEEEIDKEYYQLKDLCENKGCEVNMAQYIVMDESPYEYRDKHQINEDMEVFIIEIKNLESDSFLNVEAVTDYLFRNKKVAVEEAEGIIMKYGEEYEFSVRKCVLTKKGEVEETEEREIIDRPYAWGGKVSKKYSFGGNSQNIEDILFSKMINGQISCVNLQGIIGYEPNYPFQMVGQVKLKKCFLRPYYQTV